jgi:hypothetical protein
MLLPQTTGTHDAREQKITVPVGCSAIRCRVPHDSVTTPEDDPLPSNTIRECREAGRVTFVFRGPAEVYGG